jgi:hypothetical protein
MRGFKIIFALGAGVLTSTPALTQDTYVRGYTRNDGSYVAPHHRTNPNNSTFDNFSTRGNVNPYTGQPGTVDPYKPSNPYGANSLGSPSYGNSHGTNRRGW